MCIDNNILVFDGEAPMEYVTKKLIWNILRVRPDCDTLYVPKDVYVEFVPDEWTGFHEGIKMFGVNVIFHDDMIVMKEYYEQQGGSLAGYDSFLLLATISPFSSRALPNNTNTVIASC